MSGKIIDVLPINQVYKFMCAINHRPLVLSTNDKYSNKIDLPSFAYSRKFKIENETLNKYQKPVLLFMKHIAMLAPQGSIIVDVASGIGTTGVCMLLFIDRHAVQFVIHVMNQTLIC